MSCLVYGFLVAATAVACLCWAIAHTGHDVADDIDRLNNWPTTKENKQ